MVRIKEAEVINQLSLWCMAFLTIHQLCLKPFESSLGRSYPEAVKSFHETMIATAPAIESLRSTKPKLSPKP
jgi:hypothetical protein